MDFAAARDRMVERQIAARGVRDPRVLEAMRQVPRHLFVPERHRGEAYADRALPNAEGQTISQPYMVALMTEALAVSPGNRVLEVGTGSGYQAAVLARLGAAVFSIERHPALAAAARTALAEAGSGQVVVSVGDGSEGLPAEAPFDRILVTAAAPEVPRALQEQLAAGGRLVIPVGPRSMQHLVVVSRLESGEFRTEASHGCIFVPLVGRYGWDEGDAGPL